jgi:CDP-diacylglycerol--glycerol-3-phosphate 3-phosphatidyltransferase
MQIMEPTIYSIPNILSLLRLGLVPVLVGLALAGLGDVFLFILVISLMSDVLDGYLARKLNQTSELGAKLDSWGDVLTYASMILGLYLIWPVIFAEQAAYLFAAMMSFTVPVVLALRKFGAYPSYHTWGAKAAAVLIAPAYYVLILYAADDFFRLVIMFHVLVAVEEMMITLMLKQQRSNVGSVLSLVRELSQRDR